MNSRLLVGSLAAVLLVGAAPGVDGQEPRPASQPAAREAPASKTLTPLKITILIARFQGERKTGSLPFTLWVNAGEDRATHLRMGSEVPVPSSPVLAGPGGANVPMQFQYRSIGTSIDCTAATLDDGRFRLNLSVQDSQIFSDATAPQGSPTRGLSTFQNFTSTNVLIVRDGQTVQYMTASDKASGEVVKIDVTVNVVK